MLFEMTKISTQSPVRSRYLECRWREETSSRAWSVVASSHSAHRAQFGIFGRTVELCRQHGCRTNIHYPDIEVNGDVSYPYRLEGESLLVLESLDGDSWVEYSRM